MRDVLSALSEMEMGLGSHARAQLPPTCLCSGPGCDARVKGDSAVKMHLGQPETQTVLAEKRQDAEDQTKDDVSQFCCLLTGFTSSHARRAGEGPDPDTLSQASLLPVGTANARGAWHCGVWKGGSIINEMAAYAVCGTQVGTRELPKATG